MSFAAPLFLIAMLAGAIPVVLHLIHRRNTRQIRFSTLRFLRLSVQRTRKRRYLDEFALLALRVAVLLLIATGLARPAIRYWQGFWGQRRALAIAIILDNSASMAVPDQGRPLFDTAKQAVEDVLATAGPGDTVGLWLTGGPVDAAGAHLFSTHETVRQMLAQARVSYECADLAAKVREARRVLGQSQARAKEVYIITDNQAVSWEGFSESRRQAAEPGSGIPVVVIDVHRSPPLNVALSGITLAAPAPVTGVPIQATVEVWNTATVAQQKHVELVVDGASESLSPTLVLPAGSKVKQTFRFTLARAGLHRVEVRLVENDASPMDNRLFFALTIDQQVPVAIVKPSQAEASPADDSFYLERAFDSGNTEAGAIRAQVLSPAALVSEPLSPFAGIFCVNLPALEPRAAEQLFNYARAGGHLVWICGSNVEPAAYNAMSARTRGPLLPAPLAPLRQAAGQVESWRIGFLDPEHPALAPLGEPASLYRSVLVYKHFPIQWDPHTEARVLARLEDGQPLLAERRVGSGSVLLLGTGVHTEWTNLPLKPLFLPLWERLTFHFAGAEIERSQVRAGMPVEVPLAGGAIGRAELEVTRPSGETIRVRSPQPGSRSFSYDDTHEAGVYVLRPVNEKAAMPHTFAVNLDPREPDPAHMTRDDLMRRFRGQPCFVCENLADLPETIHRLREGVSLGHWFLAAVLIALVSEALWANRIPASPAPPAAQPQAVTSSTVSLSVGDEFLASLPER